MSITIRTAEQTDAATIQALSVQLGYAPSIKDTDRFIELLNQSNNDVVYVAILKGELVGWIHVFYTLRLESGAFCEIGGLVIDADQRGKGIGGKLVARAAEWARGKNCIKLKVRTNIIRTETHKFYAGAGFTEVKRQTIFEMNVQ